MAASADQIKKDVLQELHLHQGMVQSAHFLNSLNKAAEAYPNQEGLFWHNVVTNLVNVLVAETAFAEMCEHANIANAVFELPVLLTACINAKHANPKAVLMQALDKARDTQVCARCQGKNHVSATCIRNVGSEASGVRGRGRGRVPPGDMQATPFGVITKGQCFRLMHRTLPLIK